VPCIVNWIRGCVRPVLVPCQGEEKDGSAKGECVGQQRSDDQELCKLARRPGALEITASIVNGCKSDGEGEDVALDKGCCQERPGIDQRELGDQVEIGDDNLRVGCPLAVADGGAEDGLDAQDDEHNARHGRNIYSGRHGGLGRPEVSSRTRGLGGRFLLVVRGVNVKVPLLALGPDQPKPTPGLLR
jgi:hypothetical protein